MATAYAALLSLMQIIHDIQHHPHPPIYLHQQQIQSLTQIVSFLQRFLEAGYTNRVAYSSEADPLEMRIADAAHAVEDVIESHIVDQIFADGENVRSVDFYEALQKVIEDMESVEKQAIDVQQKMLSLEYKLSGEYSSTSVGSSSFDGPEQYTTMVGFDDIFTKVLDKLTSDEKRRQIISITGMGGMGKTTLAKNVYQRPVVKDNFPFRAWVKISQEYTIRQILFKVLEEIGENLSQIDEYRLGDILYRKLIGRKYLIVMDDVWNIEVWDHLRLFLPDNENGSRIMITTRLSNLAHQIDKSHIMEMDILDDDNSWKLFCKHVFGEEECPLELQPIAKKIVEGCHGLPLSISVVGGLLAKSERTKQYWEGIAENLNSTVNLEDDLHCLQVLYTSYNNLPVHLKPCFLYMAIFMSDKEGSVPISAVFGFLTAEGLVKPISGKSLEEAAKEYVIELVERNLILIDKGDKIMDWMYRNYTVHDLLKDLSLRESEKENFIYVMGDRNFGNIPNNIDSIRRIWVYQNTPKADVLSLLKSASLVRSLYWRNAAGGVLLASCPLLRVAMVDGFSNLEDVQVPNLRLIVTKNTDSSSNHLSITQLWNLQFLVLSGNFTLTHEIWMMPSLKFIAGNELLRLPDFCNCEMIVLENLQTLLDIYNFKWSEEVVKRIPRIKNLQICYTEVGAVDYCLHNLGLLQQLENLEIDISVELQNQNLSIAFPGSLIMLNLSGTCLHWDDLNTKIGSLPRLQFLVLDKYSCVGAKWETMEFQFRNLRFLIIIGCGDLENWMTESTHFPRLQWLFLEGLHKLKEIPSSLGEIATLEWIHLEDCCDDVYSSGRRIEEEQQELGNVDFQVVVSER